MPMLALTSHCSQQLSFCWLCSMRTQPPLCCYSHCTALAPHHAIPNPQHAVTATHSMPALCWCQFCLCSLSSSIEPGAALGGWHCEDPVPRSPAALGVNKLIDEGHKKIKTVKQRWGHQAGSPGAAGGGAEVTNVSAGSGRAGAPCPSACQQQLERLLGSVVVHYPPRGWGGKKESSGEVGREGRTWC